jgi:hypothetical protein
MIQTMRVSHRTVSAGAAATTVAIRAEHLAANGRPSPAEPATPDS